MLCWFGHWSVEVQQGFNKVENFPKRDFSGFIKLKIFRNATLIFLLVGGIDIDQALLVWSLVSEKFPKRNLSGFKIFLNFPKRDLNFLLLDGGRCAVDGGRWCFTGRWTVDLPYAILSQPCFSRVI